MLTLVLGGARSGKSRYAQSLVGERAVRYIATAQASGDAEMGRRIERHRANRPAHWRTVEAPFSVVDAVRAEGEEIIIVDCITVWLSNLSFRHRELRAAAREKRLLGEVSAFIDGVRDRNVIAVSNDVGGGIVPESTVAREFRDVQGLANQRFAEAADKVVLMVAGIPSILKG